MSGEPGGSDPTKSLKHEGTKQVEGITYPRRLTWFTGKEVPGKGDPELGNHQFFRVLC